MDYVIREGLPLVVEYPGQSCLYLFSKSEITDAIL